MTNKVKYGLKNVHYAEITEDNGEIEYGTPKRIPGAVEIALEPRGDQIEFYADDMLYYSVGNNQGYEGTLDVAIITEEFRTDILGEKETEDGVLVESTEDSGKSFALLFEFDGDKKATRHVLYRCSASRPEVSGETKDDSPEPQTDELSFVSSARAGDYRVKASTSTKTDSVIYNDWYDEVYDAEDIEENNGDEEEEEEDNQQI